MKAILLKLLPWGCIALAAFVVLRELLVDRAYQQALIRDVAEAKRDTTRALAPATLPLGDSLHAVQRRALQQEQRADALDRALGLERTAKLALEVKVRTLEVEVRATTTASTRRDSTRRAVFDVRQAPFTVQADVELPPPPAAGQLRVAVALDPVPVELRIGCAPDSGRAVRPAQVTAIGPAWADLRLRHVEQSPDICAVAARRSPRSLSRALWSDRFGVFVGATLMRRSDASLATGLAVGVGWRVWP